MEISDELYRRVKAKSALEGRPIREVTEELYRLYVRGDEILGEKLGAPSSAASTALPEDEPTPSWFGVFRQRARRAGRQDLSSIRASIAAGIARERDL